MTYTGTPAAAMAAAAWSWVEKMLQEVQVTSAPRAVRVSMRTAVWMAEIAVSKGSILVSGRRTYSCEDNQQCGHQRGAGQHRTAHGWP